LSLDSYAVHIITVSDRAAAGERPDASGPALAERFQALGYEVVSGEVIADDRATIVDQLRRACDEGRAQLVVTTGGTGLAPRDCTPEATREAGDREVPGLMEIARRRCSEITAFAALSRGIAVTRGSCLIVNLPGHPKASLETLDAMTDLLPHALKILSRPPADCDVTGKGSAEA